MEPAFQTIAQTPTPPPKELLGSTPPSGEAQGGATPNSQVIRILPAKKKKNLQEGEGLNVLLMNIIVHNKIKC